MSTNTDHPKGSFSYRAVWTGALSFDLVNIPVKLYSATQENDIKFHQAHVHGDGTETGRIQYARTCSVCKAEVAYDQIAKGYDDEAGTVILTKEDMASLPLPTLSAIEVQEFVPADQVDPILFERTYTVTPDIPAKAKKNDAAAAMAAKSYGMFTQALAASGKVGIVKVTLRQREQLAMLHVRDGRMALVTLRWADEVREMPAPTYPLATEDELALASMLIESKAADKFNPHLYEDGYRKALTAVIERNKAGIKAAPVKAESASAVPDLMAALRASIEANKARREARAVAA